MSKLPRQVQAQADAVAQHDESLTQVVETPVTQVAEDPPATPPVVPVTPAAPEPQWEHKFRTLQGIFNSTVPQLQNENKDLKARLDKLEQASLVKPVVSDEAPLITEKDSTEFGPDMIDMARRAAREEAREERKKHREELEAINKKLEATEGKIGKVAESNQQNSFEKFLDKVTSKLPSWEQIQGTEDCQAWLGTRVPGMQYSWDAALKNAADRHDVDNVLEVFNAFFAAYPTYNPVKGTQVADAKAELARQVSPTKTSGQVVTQAPSNKKIYSSAEYASKSMEQLRLEKAGQRDKAAAIEQELNTALIEGRITS